MNQEIFFSKSVVQVHSITARSVSRQFRESLKAGKAELVDTIFKLPPGDQSSRHQETVTNIINDKVSQDHPLHS